MAAPPAPTEEAADALWPDTLPWSTEEQEYYRTAADFQPAPYGTGVVGSESVIIVSQWVQPDDN
jgi:hypothetical protein